MALKEPQGSEVKDAVSSVKRHPQQVWATDVTASVENRDTFVDDRLGNVLVATADEVVVDDDLRDILVQEQVQRVRADETRTADQHDLGSSQIQLCSLWQRCAYRRAGSFISSSAPELRT